MKPEQFIQLVKDITYKPNWKITPKKYLPIISVEFAVETINVLEEQRDGSTFTLLANQEFGIFDIGNMTKDEALARIFLGISKLEEHEAQEWYKYKGEQVNPPRH